MSRQGQKKPTKEPKIRTARNFYQLTQTQYISYTKMSSSSKKSTTPTANPVRSESTVSWVTQQDPTANPVRSESTVSWVTQQDAIRELVVMQRQCHKPEQSKGELAIERTGPTATFRRQTQEVKRVNECQWSVSTLILFCFLRSETAEGKIDCFFFFFGVRPRPPPRREGPSCRKAPSRSRSRTFSSLQLVHKNSGDHAISTQQCITASGRKAECDPAPKSHSEIAYCCGTYRRMAVDSSNQRLV